MTMRRGLAVAAGIGILLVLGRASSGPRQGTPGGGAPAMPIPSVLRLHAPRPPGRPDRDFIVSDTRSAARSLTRRGSPGESRAMIGRADAVADELGR
ncbi:hypothetical protein [Actinomadura fibrosa]|uniref:Uncharacterized protein n=1 Tax=Actinomadura fibrosa TaxID=111802 RepID=A0ABW2XMN1_9ACTN|nr:hypothetical protein [Actinomadura fibrosa]